MKLFGGWRIRATVALLFGVLAGCGSSPGTTTTGPTAGDLVIRFTTPNNDDRAVQLSVQCAEAPISIAGDSADYFTFSTLQGNSGELIVVRRATQSIPANAILGRVSVNDVSKPCTPTLNSVAFRGYGVRDSFSGYSVSAQP
jgi:hypothetical protein